MAAVRPMSGDQTTTFTIIDSTVFPYNKYKDDSLWTGKKYDEPSDYQLLMRLDDERRK